MIDLAMQNRIIVLVLGDATEAISTLYFLQYLRLAAVNTHITCVTYSEYKYIFISHPQIDEVILLDKVEYQNSVLKLAKLISKRQAALLINLANNMFSALVSYKSRVPQKIVNISLAKMLLGKNKHPIKKLIEQFDFLRETGEQSSVLFSNGGSRRKLEHLLSVHSLNTNRKKVLVKVNSVDSKVLLNKLDEYTEYDILIIDNPQICQCVREKSGFCLFDLPNVGEDILIEMLTAGFADIVISDCVMTLYLALLVKRDAVSFNDKINTQKGIKTLLIENL